MHNNYKRWLANFLTGRSAHVSINGMPSKTKHIQNGVPQGSVLSPSLFNLFLHDLPPRPDNIKLYSYADDITITTKHPNYHTAATNMQHYINSLDAWLQQNKMEVSATKSSTTLFSTFNREHSAHPRVCLRGEPLPLNKNPKILGLTFDPGMTFGKHATNTRNSADIKMNVMKALASHSNGCSKENLKTLYKQSIRPTLAYASPAWHSNLADTHKKRMQTAQNQALRLITGCTRSTPIPHLHHETKILILDDHMKIQDTHFIAAAAAHPQHPCQHLLNRPLTHRNLKRTPGHTYTDTLHQLPHTPPNKSLYKHIHDTIATQSIRNLPPNSILNSQPPPINENEASLPRQTRVSLARFRCGHHTKLRAYQHRLDPNTDASCQLCVTAATEHTTQHIFTCPHLDGLRQDSGVTGVRDLWLNPLAASRFLGTAGLL